MADANDDIKNKLGNEYDLYSSLKDKFQGFNKDGDAVFKDEAGDVTAFSKADFSGMNEQLKKDYGQKSYEETFNQNQFEELAKQGNKFQGFAGDNAIFRNEKGDLENFGSQGGFASFLKKQNPNATFDISKQGQSQRTKDQYEAKADFLANKEVVKQKTGSGFTGFNPQAALQSLGGAMMNPQPELKSSVNPNIAKANNPGGTFQNFKSKQPTQPKPPAAPKYQEEEPTEEYKPPSLGDMAKQMAMQKIGDEFANLKAKGSNLLEAKKDEAQNAANNAISNATGLSTQMLTNPADAAKQEAINKASELSGFSANTLLNPEQAAKNAALGKFTDTTGINANMLNGNIGDNIQNAALSSVKGIGSDLLKQYDPTNGLLANSAQLLNGNIGDKLKDAGTGILKDQAKTYLANSGLGEYAQVADLLNGNVLDNAKNMLTDSAKGTATDLLKQFDPTGGALGDALKYTKLLKGDVVENLKDEAVDRAKKEAISQAAIAAGIDPTGGLATGALNIGKSLLKGGASSEEKGRAAAQAAARASAAYLTGGLATEQNMEMANALQNKGLDVVSKNVGKDLQPGVQAAKAYTDLGQTVGKGAVDLGLSAVGDQGAAIGRSFSDAGKAVKAITSGNIEDGLKGLGKGAANLAIQTFLKNPATIAKGIGNLGKAAVAKAAETAKAVANAAKAALNFINPFCFAPDTKILMANGKYKKIKDIKLGEEVMLGGRVTAIGQSTSDDMYLYDGVEVSGGHTLYEDGKWIRTKDSKYAVKIEVEEALVYPMDTENHLIVTKGQIWSDLSEVDNTYDKTDTDILAELNNQTEANKRLDLFLALYFKQKRK